jgi:GT2 family glycosyltransferase
MYLKDLVYSYKIWKFEYKLYRVLNFEITNKVGTSSGGDEISEFSAYWYYKNSLKFRKRIKGIKRVISITFYFVKGLVVLFKWFIKKPSIIRPMIKGISNEI